MTLPPELPKGGYTFYAVAIPPGTDVRNTAKWTAQGSATVKIGQ